MNRRTVLASAAGALGLAVLVGGGFWGAARLDEADRTAQTRYWNPAGVEAKEPVRPTVPSTPLSRLLLPADVPYQLGPDRGEKGNDYTVSGELAVARIKEDAAGLSASQRKERDRELDKLRLTGMAGRSFRHLDGSLAAEVEITQAEGKGLKQLGNFSKTLLRLLADGRKATAVPGHPEAKCYTLTVVEAKEHKEKVESLICSAYTSGTLVSFRAYGGNPFSKKDAVELLSRQLDHLKSPGERV
ncbi:hypothetical protein ACIQUQ_30765 [Streptomyces sp. NPDC101118]|uniref:hypothetical protein n=1 Tax=Streptomyces sp. NPDC101118 TaxID=3366109 RepID=UPI00382D1D19